LNDKRRFPDNLLLHGRPFDVVLDCSGHFSRLTEYESVAGGEFFWGGGNDNSPVAKLQKKLLKIDFSRKSHEIFFDKMDFLKVGRDAYLNPRMYPGLYGDSRTPRMVHREHVESMFLSHIRTIRSEPDNKLPMCSIGKDKKTVKDVDFILHEMWLTHMKRHWLGDASKDDDELLLCIRKWSSVHAPFATPFSLPTATVSEKGGRSLPRRDAIPLAAHAFLK
jgi:hypothetical protein